MVTWRGDMQAVRPMLATLEDAPLTSVGLVYEPKYDGIRALVEVDPSRRGPVRMWSRLGNEKTALEWLQKEKGIDSSIRVRDWKLKPRFGDLSASDIGCERQIRGRAGHVRIVFRDEHGHQPGRSADVR